MPSDIIDFYYGGMTMIITNEMPINELMEDMTYRFTLYSIAIDDYQAEMLKDNSDDWLDDHIACITATAEQTPISLKKVIQAFMKNDFVIIVMIDTRTINKEHFDAIDDTLAEYNKSVDEDQRFTHVIEKEWGVYFMRKRQE